MSVRGCKRAYSKQQGLNEWDSEDDGVEIGDAVRSPRGGIPARGESTGLTQHGDSPTRLVES